MAVEAAADIAAAAAELPTDAAAETVSAAANAPVCLPCEAIKAAAEAQTVVKECTLCFLADEVLKQAGNIHDSVPVIEALVHAKRQLGIDDPAVDAVVELALPALQNDPHHYAILLKAYDALKAATASVCLPCEAIKAAEAAEALRAAEAAETIKVAAAAEALKEIEALKAMTSLDAKTAKLIAYYNAAVQDLAARAAAEAEA